MAKLTTMAELVAGCKAWKGNDALFPDIVASYLELSGLSQEDLADVFEAATSTVSRWANGVARPHPRMEKLVVAWIEKRARKVVESASATGGSSWTPVAAAAKPR